MLFPMDYKNFKLIKIKWLISINIGRLINLKKILVTISPIAEQKKLT